MGKRDSKPTRRRGYKFRVSIRTTMHGLDKATEASFRYNDLVLATKGYKAMLLDLYRKKNVKSFAICLNRCTDPKWSNPIYKETDG
jgi:hypothetical protein